LKFGIIFPTHASSNTTLIPIALHPKSDGYFSFFLKDYEPDQDLEFSFYSFKLTFQGMPHLLTNGISGMVFEHLRNYYHPEDSTSGFPQLFQLCFHIAYNHIPPQIAHVLGLVRLLAMTNPLNGVHPIVVGETLY
jgi:hypothetical protein